VKRGHGEKKAVNKNSVEKKPGKAAYKRNTSGRLFYTSPSVQPCTAVESSMPHSQIEAPPPPGVYINLIDSDSSDNSGGHGSSDLGQHGNGDQEHHGSNNPGHHGGGDDSSGDSIYEDSSNNSDSPKASCPEPYSYFA
jgi:hypothetical protein